MFPFQKLKVGFHLDLEHWKFCQISVLIVLFIYNDGFLDITGDKLRTRKLPLDIPEQTDTEYEYSEFSPSPMGHDLPPLSPIPSESGSPKNMSDEQDMTASDISHQMTTVHEAEVCDAKLSPILFQDTKATSPMGVKGTAGLLRSTKDASSSPPQHTTQSASTSPPKRGDLDPSAASTAVTSPCDSQLSKDIKHQSSLDFDMEIDHDFADGHDEIIKTNSNTTLKFSVCAWSKKLIE